MNDPVSILFSHVMEEDIYKAYIGDLKGFQAHQKATFAAYDRLCALLDAPTRKELDSFLDEEIAMDSICEEAAFTAGLSIGLQLLRLL